VTAATFGGPGLVQIHIPITEAGRAECRALPDCPDVAPAHPSGWLSRLVDGGDPIEALRQAAAGAADELTDPALRVALGL
jgi:hypothetical protein